MAGSSDIIAVRTAYDIARFTVYAAKRGQISLRPWKGRAVSLQTESTFKTETETGIGSRVRIPRKAVTVFGICEKTASRPSVRYLPLSVQRSALRRSGVLDAESGGKALCFFRMRFQNPSVSLFAGGFSIFG